MLLYINNGAYVGKSRSYFLSFLLFEMLSFNHILWLMPYNEMNYLVARKYVLFF